eukprot:2489898-Amphidinium_carterae.1
MKPIVDSCSGSKLESNTQLYNLSSLTCTHVVNISCAASRQQIASKPFLSQFFAKLFAVWVSSVPMGQVGHNPTHDSL